MKKMKRITIALLLVLISCWFLFWVLDSATVDATSAIVWEDYFPNDPIFDGGVFTNDNISEEPDKEPEKNWEIIDGRIFPPGWANETRSGNFPPGWFNETPREEYNLKPDGWFEVNTRLY